MSKYYEKFLDGKRSIIDVIIISLFLISTKKRQNYLIEKNACMFLGLQNFAKKFDNNGDLRTSMHISGNSYKYLGNFAMYCDAWRLPKGERAKLRSKTFEGIAKAMAMQWAS